MSGLIWIQTVWQLDGIPERIFWKGWFVRPALDPNFLTAWWHSWTIFLKKLILKKSLSRQQKKIVIKLPSMQTVNSLSVWTKKSIGINEIVPVQYSFDIVCPSIQSIHLSVLMLPVCTHKQTLLATLNFQKISLICCPAVCLSILTNEPLLATLKWIYQKFSYVIRPSVCPYSQMDPCWLLWNLKKILLCCPCVCLSILTNKHLLATLNSQNILLCCPSICLFYSQMDLCWLIWFHKKSLTLSVRLSVHTQKWTLVGYFEMNSQKFSLSCPSVCPYLQIDPCWLLWTPKNSLKLSILLSVYTHKSTIVGSFEFPKILFPCLFACLYSQIDLCWLPLIP